MRRFFSADSFWNAPLEKSPEIDPRNDHFIRLLGNKPGRPFWINLHKYTIPVYGVDASWHNALKEFVYPAAPGRASSNRTIWSGSRCTTTGY